MGLGCSGASKVHRCASERLPGKDWDTLFPIGYYCFVHAHKLIVYRIMHPLRIAVVFIASDPFQGQSE